jgi:glucose/arabinose dehydrogenase
MPPAGLKNLLHVVGIRHKSLPSPPPMRFHPLLALLFSFSLGTTAARAEEAVGLEQAFPGLSFSLPVAVSPLPGSKDTVFVIEKGDPAPSPDADKAADKKKKASAFFGGKVQMISGLGSAQVTKTQVFQLNPKDGKFDAAGECGFLGFAVHPKVAETKQVFVYYSLRIDGKLHQRVSRFKLSSLQPFVVDADSEQPLITQLDPAANHNGGDLHFGPDGYLYISCGDGGAGGDAFDTAGYINKGFHAAVFRIDVDKKPGNPAPNPHPSVITDGKGEAFYAVPADNPFLKATSHRGRPLEAGSVRTETWATGLRNAWRFSFDPKTGACFAGDVGQNLYEEIDILVSGGDYGWHDVEGNHVFNQKDASGKKAAPGLAAPSAFIAPIHEYDRKLGNSVTGGVVYRGDRVPAIADAYVFADFASGRIFALRENGGKWVSQQVAKDNTISGFGYDPSNGDVLVASLAGQVKRIVKK